MTYLPSSSLPFSPGSISSYIKGHRTNFDDEWAIRTACDVSGIGYDSDPDEREKRLAEVIDSDPKRFGIFARTYEAIRPLDNVRAEGSAVGYSSGKPKRSGRWALVFGIAGGLVLGAAAYAHFVAGQVDVKDVQTNDIVKLVDEDLDGIPDDVERQLGYSIGERDVTLKYFIQNPTGFSEASPPYSHLEYKTLVDAALERVVIDYREKNPLHINIHPVYGGEVPYDATFDNGGIYKFQVSMEPRNTPDNKYAVLGYFLERKGTDRTEGGAAGGIGIPEFHVFLDSNADPPMLATTEHELGHTMGIDHSRAPFSVMNDTTYRQTDFVDGEWAFKMKERLYDFRCFGEFWPACEAHQEYVPR